MVRASVGIEHGVLPPTSDMCPNIDAQPTTRPSSKIGMTTSQSLAWLIARAARVGVGGEQHVALLDRSPSKPSRKSGMDRPNWPTTIFPLGSAISGNSSCCSRMPGESAVRNSTSSIS